MGCEYLSQLTDSHWAGCPGFLMDLLKNRWSFPIDGNTIKRTFLTILILFVNVSLFESFSKRLQAADRLRLATTTSTDNSGLLRVLLPPFEKSYQTQVDVISVGTGKALELGRNGDVDVVMVHSPDEEIQFVREGYGVDRKQFMYNDLVLLGPSGDPARIRKVRDAHLAFSLIAKTGAAFVSRGDHSGTHKAERRLWKKARYHPNGTWYLEVGQGMGKTLLIANERQAYTLSDLATYLVFRNSIGSEILLRGDPSLFNPYGIIAVNPRRHPHVQHRLAIALIKYVTGSRGQEIIRKFTVSGQLLFNPIINP